MCKMAKISGERALAFDKRLKYVGNDLKTWKVAKIFGKWLRYISHDLSF